MGLTLRTHPASRVCNLAAITLTLLCSGLQGCKGRSLATVQAKSSETGETIVLIRHGEIPEHGLGQLDCEGLNRALALPKVFRSRFATPSGIYASDPADTITEDGGTYSYVRPLATIEPTAIALGIAVNTEIGYTNIASLQAAVTEFRFAKGTVLIAWEHYEAYLFARNLVSTYGQNPAEVPAWPSGDFDMMYVFYITQPSDGSKGTLKFEKCNRKASQNPSQILAQVSKEALRLSPGFTISMH